MTTLNQLRAKSTLSAGMKMLLNETGAREITQHFEGLTATPLRFREDDRVQYGRISTRRAGYTDIIIDTGPGGEVFVPVSDEADYFKGIER